MVKSNKIWQNRGINENYYITASAVLSLAQRALEIFRNSEIMEKRQLLNFLLQNPQLKGKELVFTLKAPFDRVLEANRCVEMLRSLAEVRTLPKSSIGDFGQYFQSSFNRGVAGVFENHCLAVLLN